MKTIVVLLVVASLYYAGSTIISNANKVLLQQDCTSFSQYLRKYPSGTLEHSFYEDKFVENNCMAVLYPTK